jgi:F0F1-type ATP synthase assembly protein I
MTTEQPILDDWILFFDENEKRDKFIHSEIIKIILQGFLMVLALGCVNVIVIILYYHWR